MCKKFGVVGPVHRVLKEYIQSEKLICIKSGCFLNKKPITYQQMIELHLPNHIFG